MEVDNNLVAVSCNMAGFVVLSSEHDQSAEEYLRLVTCEKLGIAERITSP